MFRVESVWLTYGARVSISVMVRVGFELRVAGMKVGTTVLRYRKSHYEVSLSGFGCQETGSLTVPR